MNKQYIAQELFKKHPELTIEKAREIVEIFFNEIITAIVNMERVEIRDFGTFVVRRRNPRKARNPRTNQLVEVKERGYIYFRAGKNLLIRTNNKANQQSA